MKKTALFKDFYREILKNKGRFISIFLIVTLGVAFFSGIRAAEPDMRLTGDRYFDDARLYDGYAASTLGITDADLVALSELPLITDVYGEHSVDVLSQFDGRERVLRVAGVSDTMNILHVEKGRLPERSGELVLDANLMPEETTFKSGGALDVGSKITFASGTEDALDEILKEETYTIVGFVSAPRYFSFGRGTTTIGTGDVFAYAYISDEDFLTDYYSYAYYHVAGAEELVSFSDAYQALCDEAASQVESIEGIRCEVRYDETYGEGMREILDAKEEIEDARVELSDGEQELSDAKQEIADARQKLIDAQNTLNASRTQADRAFADSLAQLQNVQETLQNGRREIEAGWKQVEDLKKQLEEQQTMLEQGREQLEQGRAQLQQLETAYQAALSQAGSIPSGPTGGEGSGEEGSEAGEGGSSEGTPIVPSVTPEQLETMRMQIEALKTQLQESEAQLQQLAVGNGMLDQAITQADSQLSSSEAELKSGEAELAAGWQTYYAKRAETEEKLGAAQSEINSNTNKLLDADEEIAENEQKLLDGYKELEENEQKMADAEEELEKISYPEWFLMDRMDDADYSGFNDNAERMAKIGRVFPVIFFLLAALISLTTMTRMVEEERIQIGTLKALGYSRLSIAAKFICYAGLATVLGSAVGIFLGEKTLPYIILHAYTIMYPHLTEFLVPINWYYGLMASGAAVCSVLAATIYSCWKTLQEVPAELMLPPSPQSGKRILMERIVFIWKRMNFSWKATFRNLSRYKKRLVMTVVGIGGCMALLMAGFGLRDSIMEVVTLQYVEIQQYDEDVYLKSDPSDEDIQELEETLNRVAGPENYLRAALKKMDVQSETGTRNVYLCVPEDPKSVESFVKFRSRLGHEEYHLSDTGVILTEKAAKLLEVGVGDRITMEIIDGKHVEVPIESVTENYMSHYVYMTPGLYEKLAGETPDYNDCMVNTGDADAEENEAIGKEILENDCVMSVSYLISLKERLDTMLTTLDSVIIVLIISAGLLAFVVLYNLNNINITERRREMATLKVLGFHDLEVALYVYRENIFMTIYGILTGLILGRLLHMFLITTVEVDMVMFGRNMFLASYIYSVLITILFAIVVNWVMYYKLKSIDMVESLKSVE